LFFLYRFKLPACTVIKTYLEKIEKSIGYLLEITNHSSLLILEKEYIHKVGQSSCRNHFKNKTT